MVILLLQELKPHFLKNLQYQVSKLKASILETLKSEFEKSDQNRDGRLNKNEFQLFLRSQGYNLSDKELLLMVNYLNIYSQTNLLIIILNFKFYTMKPDENGCIDFNEFLRFNKGDLNDGDDEKNESRNFFLHLDADRNGLISFEEFKIFTDIHNDFSSMSQQQLKELFDKADLDKDGKITEEGKLLMII